MKNTLELIGKILAAPRHIVELVGWLAVGLFAMSHYPEYTFITKYIVTLALTH